MRTTHASGNGSRGAAGIALLGLLAWLTLGGCGDSGPGTAATPVCSFGEALDRLPQAPGIFTIADDTSVHIGLWPRD